MVYDEIMKHTQKVERKLCGSSEKFNKINEIWEMKLITEN